MIRMISTTTTLDVDQGNVNRLGWRSTVPLLTRSTSSSSRGILAFVCPSRERPRRNAGVGAVSEGAAEPVAMQRVAVAVDRRGRRGPGVRRAADADVH